MKKIVVTGGRGFIGSHLLEALSHRPDLSISDLDGRSAPNEFEQSLLEADVIYHLAGVNRPVADTEFETGNVGLTEWICDTLRRAERRPLLVMSSSIQAESSSPYGVSKWKGESVIVDWTNSAGGAAVVFRLKNTFGKWCRPNYNSVTATFCHNIAHNLPISISDPSRELELVYIDDVIRALLGCLDCPPVRAFEYRDVARSYRVTLGELANAIRGFRDSRRTLVLPGGDDEFLGKLYVTYLSYLGHDNFAYSLEKRVDARGCLAEFLKSPRMGQIFVSRTKPGVTRGNHYHHSKTEKFLVLEGDAVVRFRRYGNRECLEYRVSGVDLKVIDIPPGYTHSIENIGQGELVTLFWANEIFDPARPDTIALPVLE
jgi:UDP-2-acetamido-2,6-beta-L-arabino-hexul-4-ose reductase